MRGDVRAQAIRLQMDLAADEALPQLRDIDTAQVHRAQPKALTARCCRVEVVFNPCVFCASVSGFIIWIILASARHVKPYVVRFERIPSRYADSYLLEVRGTWPEGCCRFIIAVGLIQIICIHLQDLSDWLQDPATEKDSALYDECSRVLRHRNQAL